MDESALGATAAGVGVGVGVLATMVVATNRNVERCFKNMMFEIFGTLDAALFVVLWLWL